MADTPRTPTRVDGNLATGAFVWEWTGLDGDDTGVPVFTGKCQNITVQIDVGTHGGATSTFEGTIEPRGNPAHASHASAIWSPLTDTTETVISCTTADLPLTKVLQDSMWIRPKTASGTGTINTFWLYGSTKS